MISDSTEIEYRVIGVGDKKDIEKCIIDNDVRNSVVIQGTIPHDKVFSWLDSLDVFIQPSRTEGLPRALIEAMSRGLPCIGSNVGGIPELLDERYIFDVKHNSVKTIANLIKELSITENQKIQAIRNFNRAKDFQRHIIDNRNKAFFKQFDRYARENNEICCKTK